MVFARQFRPRRVHSCPGSRGLVGTLGAVVVRQLVAVLRLGLVRFVRLGLVQFVRLGLVQFVRFGVVGWRGLVMIELKVNAVRLVRDLARAGKILECFEKNSRTGFDPVRIRKNRFSKIFSARSGPKMKIE